MRSCSLYVVEMQVIFTHALGGSCTRHAHPMPPHPHPHPQTPPCITQTVLMMIAAYHLHCP